MPGWRTDWMYARIFREVGNLWEEVRTGDPRMGTPPEQLRVEEMCGADWEGARCLPPVRRVWTFGPDGLHPQMGEAGPAECGAARGMFWQVGLVRFHVAVDRRRLVLEYAVGPRYGRGRVFRVAGQGKKGRLCPVGITWIS